MAVEYEPAVQGRVERVHNGVVEGWAWSPSAADKRLELRVWLDGREVGGTVAELARPSLATAGIGDGEHAFRFVLPASFASAGPHSLRIEADGQSLPPAVGFAAVGEGETAWDGAHFTVEGVPQAAGETGTTPAGVEGRIEQVSNGIVEGWAWHPDAPDTRVLLEVLLDGESLGTTIAELPRPSLAAAGIGDGRYAFRFALAAGIASPGLHRLCVHAAGEGLPASSGFSAAAEHDDPWYAARFIVVLGEEVGADADPPPVALVGLGGWLFDSQDVRRSMADDASMRTERNAAELLDTLDKLQERLDGLGLRLLPVLCPLKENVYLEFLPRAVRQGFERRPGESLIRGLLEHPVLDLLDLMPALSQAAERYPAYASVSPLLSEWGAYIAYRATVKRTALIVAGVTPPVELAPDDMRDAPSRRWEGRAEHATDLGFVPCLAEELPEPPRVPVVAAPAGAAQRTPQEHLARIGAQFTAGWEQPDRDELARGLFVGLPAHEAVAEWAARHFRFTVMVGADAPVVDVVSLERPDVVVYFIDERALLAGSRA
jgi:hypothetical protein